MKKEARNDDIGVFEYIFILVTFFDDDKSLRIFPGMQITITSKLCT